MVTVEQAIAAVREANTPWPIGDFMVDEVRENDAYFGVTFGARQAIIDDDPLFVMDGQWPAFVNKVTGVIETPPGVGWIIEALKYLDDMTVVIPGYQAA